MKIKGLSKTQAMIESLDSAVQENIYEIEWSGDQNASDQQRDDYYNKAANLLENAREALNKIDGLKLGDF